MIILIDNYDSFTFNVFHYLSEIGAKVKLYIQAGGGIVFDSDPEKEFQETINKANALIAAAKDSYRYK